MNKEAKNLVYLQLEKSSLVNDIRLFDHKNPKSIHCNVDEIQKFSNKYMPNGSEMSLLRSLLKATLGEHVNIDNRLLVCDDNSGLYCSDFVSLKCNQDHHLIEDAYSRLLQRKGKIQYILDQELNRE